MNSEAHDAPAADRRRFLTLCAGSIAIALAAKNSAADELPHVAPDDPTANALGYVEDAAKVDASKYPQHLPSQACMNCKQFGKQANSGFGSCQIFSGKVVNQHGWCAAYVPNV